MLTTDRILLTPETLTQGVSYLTKLDPDLNQIYQEYGSPPLWQREKGFPTLVHIILEQQVSLASAQAAFDRLLELGALSPESFLSRDDATLKKVGFSRQKTLYVRLLAQAIIDSKLDLAHLESLDYAAAHAELIKIKGIGDWTANIYLLMASGYSDIFPKGDLALILALQAVKKLPVRPGVAEIELISAAWQPWRSVAAFMLWHYYLSKKKPLK
jgi:DNA-3-methyladenine glycosylase II